MGLVVEEVGLVVEIDFTAFDEFCCPGWQEICV